MGADEAGKFEREEGERGVRDQRRRRGLLQPRCHDRRASGGRECARVARAASGVVRGL